MYEGKLVRLRAITREDLPRYVAWINDWEVARHLEFFRPVNLEGEERWYNSLLESSDDNFVFAVETLEGRHIGSVGLHQVHSRHRSAMMGIFIGDKEHWGRGCGSDAIRLMIRYGFEMLNLNRIWLQVFEFNERAIRCYEKCGFRREGTLRQAHYSEGQYCDVRVMGILRGEYVRSDE